MLTPAAARLDLNVTSGSNSSSAAALPCSIHGLAAEWLSLSYALLFLLAVSNPLFSPGPLRKTVQMLGAVRSCRKACGSEPRPTAPKYATMASSGGAALPFNDAL